MTPMLREMTVKYRTARGATDTPIPLGPARTPDDVARVLHAVIGDDVTEVFGCLLLDSRLRVIAWHEVSRGTLNATVVEPRDVFRAAILANAAGVIIAHLHPSGDASPSTTDVALTTRLVDAGRLLGIPVHDHVIIGGGTGRHYSFTACGRL